MIQLTSDNLFSDLAPRRNQSLEQKEYPDDCYDSEYDGADSTNYYQILFFLSPVF